MGRENFNISQVSFRTIQHFLHSILSPIRSHEENIALLASQEQVLQIDDDDDERKCRRPFCMGHNAGGHWLHVDRAKQQGFMIVSLRLHSF